MSSRSSLYTIGFAAALSVACAVLLTGVSALLAERQERNRRLDEIVNILAVLKIDLGPAAAARDIEAAYQANVEAKAKDGVKVYVLKAAQPGGSPRAYAFEVRGMGLWGPVKGLLAVEPDLDTIRGIRFYEQEETPGLGGRIGETEFTQKFEGKRLRSADGAVGLRIVMGAAADDPHAVDAITGATLTCKAVEQFVNEDIRAFLKVMP